MSKNQIVVVDPDKFGITSTIAEGVEANFVPMIAKMVELEKEFNIIVKMDIEDKETAKKAKELRLKYVKTRTGTAEIHKAQKDHYLRVGKYIDGWKNTQEFASQGKEEALRNIENYFENKRIAAEKKLEEERAKLVSPYVEDTSLYTLGTMEQDVFEAFLTAKKTAHQDRINAEKAAEKEREKLAKEETLRAERKQLLIPFWNFISPEEREQDLGKMTEKDFKASLKKYELQKKKVDAENEATRLENERLREENRKNEEARKLLQKRSGELQPYIVFIRDYNSLINSSEEDYQKQLKEIQSAAWEQTKYDNEQANKKVSLSTDRDFLMDWIEGFNIENPSVKNDVSDEIMRKFHSFKKWCVTQVDRTYPISTNK